MELKSIAKNLSNIKEKIVLIYAFNATGKTRLSVAYKDETKDKEQHTGVYYNAFSEDIFVWDNDSKGDEENIRIIINQSSLNKFHSNLTEDLIREKLKSFQPNFDFEFSFYENPEKGIESISFFLLEDEDRNRIKISRGEERIFVWCFFLALFDVEGWSNKQSNHFFIDDPVSSLDDHNIFITASTIFDLIEKHCKQRKFIITTHHIGLFSILTDWLTKGEKSNKYKDKTKLYILSQKSGKITLESPKNDVFLYHLHLLQLLEKASEEDQLYRFHFALLRQILENITSFLGTSQISYVLSQIGIINTEEVARNINALSHQKVYQFQTEVMPESNEKLFREVFSKIKTKYNFKLHT